MLEFMCIGTNESFYSKYHLIQHLAEQHICCCKSFFFLFNLN